MKHPPSSQRMPSRWRPSHALGVALFTLAGLALLKLYSTTNSVSTSRVPPHAAATLARCSSLNLKAGPPADFHERKQSDRFVPGTRATLIRDARIWTGNLNGTEVVRGNVLLDRGLIQAIARGPHSLDGPWKDIDVIDAEGAWLTPGIVDVHSHIGDGSSPALSASEDYNSEHGIAQPWLRSLDGLNTHDDSYELSIAGGVTTALVLPGSGNAIGGQAFVIKNRKTAERTTASLLLEPPFTINGTVPSDGSLRWRYLKQACGENPASVYSGTRMDNIWSMRQVYQAASEKKREQDEYCERALAHDWEGLGEFPESLQWEALVDVLRGRVKVQTHCYEAVDLDALIRLSQEFSIPLSAVHHASEAYLVPELLKSAYGPTPAVALFATNMRYKREAYRGSEFAPRILTENGLRVVMKSDHSVLVERDLIFEAQQAFFYGLPSNVALASVTSSAAIVLGLDHRIGYIKQGYDADLVLWDSHPLALGATPKQVWSDGIAQLKTPHVAAKPDSFQEIPKVPNFDDEARKAVEHDGLPPLSTKSHARTVVFTGVRDVLHAEGGGVVPLVNAAHDDDDLATVVVINGTVACAGRGGHCDSFRSGLTEDPEVMELRGGAIQPGLISFGSPLGLQEIDQEASTGDGAVLDPFTNAIPGVLGGLGGATVRAVDGLMFGGRDLLHAFRAGTTSAISAPRHWGFYGGLSVHFNAGAPHKLAKGAVLNAAAALHVSISMSSSVSVSSQIGALRRLLLQGGPGELGRHFEKVVKGDLILVVNAHSADIIASVIALKKEVEGRRGHHLKLTITGATEAHLLAKELAEAHVGVVLNPFRSFPYEWEQRRILPGPPLSEKSSVRVLVEHGVTVGLGVRESWEGRNTRFYVAWAALEANGTLSREQALALGSINLQQLLTGAASPKMDLVATMGGDLLSFEGKVAAVISPHDETVHVL